MNIFYLLLISLFFLPSDKADDKIKEMCDCLATAKKTGTKEDKGKCLVLQEKIVKQLGENTEAHKKFTKGTDACMKELFEKKAQSKEFGEQVREICDCAKDAGSNSNQLMSCMQLQNTYAKSYGEDTLQKQKLIQQTNDCLFSR
jgi:hypothetical protein